jgi:hypothetical protein
LIGTLILSAGVGVLLASFRGESPSTPARIVDGGMVSVRPGVVSLAQLVALSVGSCCVIAGLFLWMR